MSDSNEIRRKESEMQMVQSFRIHGFSFRGKPKIQVLFQMFPRETALKGLYTKLLHRDTKGPLLCFVGQQQILTGLPNARRNVSLTNAWQHFKEVN